MAPGSHQSHVLPMNNQLEADVPHAHTTIAVDAESDDSFFDADPAAQQGQEEEPGTPPPPRKLHAIFNFLTMERAYEELRPAKGPGSINFSTARGRAPRRAEHCSPPLQQHHRRAELSSTSRRALGRRQLPPAAAPPQSPAAEPRRRRRRPARYDCCPHVRYGSGTGSRETRRVLTSGRSGVTGERCRSDRRGPSLYDCADWRPRGRRDQKTNKKVKSAKRRGTRGRREAKRKKNVYCRTVSKFSTTYNFYKNRKRKSLSLQTNEAPRAGVAGSGVRSGATV